MGGALGRGGAGIEVSVGIASCCRVALLAPTPLMSAPSSAMSEALSDTGVCCSGVPHLTPHSVLCGVPHLTPHSVV